MKLRNTYGHNKSLPVLAGFTLIEILISIGVLSLLAGIGLFMSMEVYTHSSLMSEKDLIVSILQKARSLAMTNTGNETHGVHIQAAPSIEYIIFEGSSYTERITSKDIVINGSESMTISNGSEIVFERLSGECVACENLTTIHIHQDGKSYAITVNKEGGIDWY